MWHSYNKDISSIPRPSQFTYPFHYTPHPLCIEAARELKEYLTLQSDWQEELEEGKMFGVMAVESQEGEVGFLAAFSGILAGSNRHSYFVPPIYDLQDPNGFFKKEEACISAINREISQLENDASFQNIQQETIKLQKQYESEREEMKAHMRASKEKRDKLRRESKDDKALMDSLIKESQFEKAELKRQEQAWKLRIQEQQSRAEHYLIKVADLKKERKDRSAALQDELFRHYRIQNALGEVTDLTTLFAETAHRTPPGGAGECAAPKLLQYAYLNHLRPLCMAEFWWGHSSKVELRRHGAYYPACQNKCAPILEFMMRGLDVESNPLIAKAEHHFTPQIIYEDAYLMIISKPSGLLSVPGKGNGDSVYDYIRRLRPEAEGPLILHRLDQATSGLMIIAKTKEVHELLQKQFVNREVKKRYKAILEKEIADKAGHINLPLCPNPEDRPRQMVHYEYGKTAETRYEVLKKSDGRTHITFYPHTGRTHQLRVHAAHPEGLHAPIKGDRLYGSEHTEGRLYLHADCIVFYHPVLHERMMIEINTPF